MRSLPGTHELVLLRLVTETGADPWPGEAELLVADEVVAVDDRGQADISLPPGRYRLGVVTRVGSEVETDLWVRPCGGVEGQGCLNVFWIWPG